MTVKTASWKNGSDEWLRWDSIKISLAIFYVAVFSRNYLSVCVFSKTYLEKKVVVGPLKLLPQKFLEQNVTIKMEKQFLTIIYSHSDQKSAQISI